MNSVTWQSWSGATSDRELYTERLLAAWEALDSETQHGTLIHRAERADVISQVEGAFGRRASGGAVPLMGIPCVVKDNIDVRGMPTTAACPAYRYVAGEDAGVVRRLRDAGAIILGKANMDQFATGLVGTRSPYGVGRCPFNSEYISGGSSSGSALAVARGMAVFALGTDTAGSGRVPAGFCNLVGLKPTRGALSARGVVPACRSLDCVSIFALTCSDARGVYDVVAGYDAGDPWSRRPAVPATPWGWGGLRVGVPRVAQRFFDGDGESESAYSRALDRARQLGATITEIDFDLFSRVAQLLYNGPWVVERLEATSELLGRSPEAFLPVLRTILEGAKRVTAEQVFEGQRSLQRLRRESEQVWNDVDVLLLPTAPRAYRVEEAQADVTVNSRLGTYTNFVNLLDLSGVALPNGFLGTGVPSGVTLLAPASHEQALLSLGEVWHDEIGGQLGATAEKLASAGVVTVERQSAARDPLPVPTKGFVQVAVVGAHLSGQPLNGQLVERGARLVGTLRTAPEYRFYLLPGTSPLKPGLVKVGVGGTGGGGASIEVEVWEVSQEKFGSFVAMVPPPLCIGTVCLETRQEVKGFLCEPHAVRGARDISWTGGWRRFLVENR
jgi:allophanate hydrolase